MIRCAAYARMSQDENRDGLGVERQLDAIDKFAAEHGWAVDPRWRLAETASASVKKRRPEFERLMGAIERGEVSLLVVFAADRLTRRLHDTARVLDVVEATGCEVFFVAGGDLGSGYSRGMAGVLGGVAAMEVEVMSERHRNQIAQSRRKGNVTNGGRRAFGYESDRKTPVPEEFDLLREAFDRLGRGDGISAIVKDWNRREIKTATQRRPLGHEGDWVPSDSRWTTRTLRETLARPALAGRVMEWQQRRGDDGRRVREQVRLVDAAGVPVVGQWPAVFDDTEFDQLQTLLAARKQMPPGWTSETTHLLTGVLRCGRCGGRMVSHRQTSGVRAYMCRDFRHLARNEDHLDAHVLAQVHERISDAQIPVEGWTDPRGAEIARRLGDLEQRKTSTIQRLVDGGLTPDTVAQTLAEFDRQIDALRGEQVQEVAQQFQVAEFRGFPDLADLPFKERRRLMTMVVHQIVVQPARRGRGFDPSTVEIEWWPNLTVERAWGEGDDEVALVLRRAPRTAQS